MMERNGVEEEVKEEKQILLKLLLMFPCVGNSTVR
jgi:hypothetical protein